MSQMSSAKPVIGIVGGVGAGKSTVAAELVRLGCALVDGDAIGHDLLCLPEVSERLRCRWGEGIFLPDGAVDREGLGRIVFADPAERRALDEILHPRIRRSMERQIAEMTNRPEVKAVVVDAAVLFEAVWDDLCTHRVFVDCPAEARARRVLLGRRWDRATWAAREKSQFSLDKKARMCDYMLSNSSSVSHLVEQVRSFFCEIA